MEKWLQEISWDQLKDWLDYRDLEPFGEVREDLRIGALASVILNTTIDTEKIGGMLHPYSYVSGWSEERVYSLGMVPREVEKVVEDDSDKTLNNPIVWNNFVTRLQKGLRKVT